MIKVICPGCGKAFAAKDENLGRKTRCRSCKAVLRIEGEKLAEPKRREKPAAAPAAAATAPEGETSTARSRVEAAKGETGVEGVTGAEGSRETPGPGRPGSREEGAGETEVPPPLPEVAEPTYDAPPATVKGVAARSDGRESTETKVEKPSLALANTSLGCGCAGLVVPGVNVAAIVTGIIALGREESEAFRQRSRPRALGGIGLGLLGLFVHLVALMLYAASSMMGGKPAATAPTVAAVPAPAPAPAPVIDQAPAAPLAVPTATPPSAPGPQQTQAFFYDLNTGQLFPADKKLIPAIDAPSGPLPDGSQAGVRAWVFSCGSCGDVSTRFIGWYERMVPSAKKLRTEGENANVNIDELIEGYSTQFEISEDAKTWAKMHAVVYLQWQLEKRKSMCPSVGFATECHP